MRQTSFWQVRGRSGGQPHVRTYIHTPSCSRMTEHTRLWLSLTAAPHRTFSPTPQMSCRYFASICLPDAQRCGHLVGAFFFKQLHHRVRLVLYSTASPYHTLSPTPHNTPAGLAAILLHFVFLMFNIVITWVARFPEAERKAIIIMASQKNLPTAATIISYFDPASVGNLGLITIPCIVFYIMQVRRCCVRACLGAREGGVRSRGVMLPLNGAWFCYTTDVFARGNARSCCIDSFITNTWATRAPAALNPYVLPPLPCSPQLFIDSFIANTWASKYERIAAIEAKYEEEIKALESDDGSGTAAADASDPTGAAAKAKVKAAAAAAADSSLDGEKGGLLGTKVSPDVASPAALSAGAAGLAPIRAAVAAARMAAASATANGGSGGGGAARGGGGGGSPMRIARLSSGEDGGLLTNVALDDVDPLAKGRQQGM